MKKFYVNRDGLLRESEMCGHLVFLSDHEQEMADLRAQLNEAKALLRRWGTERDPEVMSTIGQLTDQFLQPELYDHE